MAQVSAKKCSLCDENNGEYYCYECQHALCTACRNRHGKIPALNGHTVADINTINLSSVNKTTLCGTHDNKIQFYCTECIDLICIKCVTSTHKSHTISDITDVVKEERENAEENIEKLKLKTETLSSLEEKIRREHIENLHAESKTSIGHIESVSKNLQDYLTAKGSIKISEIEDKETTENQNFEAFLKNIDLIKKRYVHILSELESLLLEKHDITFHSGYRSLQSDIHTLDSIPEEPLFAKVPIFEDEFLFKEVMEYMESKMEKSLCQICPVQKKEIEDLKADYNTCKETFKRDLATKDDELKTLSENIKSLKEEKKTMQSTLNQKYFDQKKQIGDLQYDYTVRWDSFHRDLKTKDDKLKLLSEEINSLYREKYTLQFTLTNATKQEDDQMKKLKESVEHLQRDRDMKDYRHQFLLKEKDYEHQFLLKEKDFKHQYLLEEIKTLKAENKQLDSRIGSKCPSCRRKKSSYTF
ncbi:uncharacterized protein LOC143079804 [Mytilus galloprovincialis]|uniref:uncharacterized protein LOC143079804 n=1 Tax=Mytilus galloprovincialis TaxID=29158 RepID=UPI003F7BDF22